MMEPPPAECNPDNIVSILTMGSPSNGELVPPTSDLKEIMSELKDLDCEPFGETEFQKELKQACRILSSGPKNMKRRLLMFVGSLIHLELSKAISYGRELKNSGVALDVFNLYDCDIDPILYKNCTMLCSKYHYARKELGTLVTNANYNGSSHIADVFDKSEVLDILSNSTLKEHLDYLSQKAAADEKYKSATDENINVKQEVGPTHRKRRRKRKDRIVPKMMNVFNNLLRKKKKKC